MAAAPSPAPAVPANDPLPVTAIAAGPPPLPAPRVLPQPSSSSAEPAVWPRAAQLATVALLGLAAILIAVYAYGSMRYGSRPTELQRGKELVYRVDLNRASRAELRNLPGVGDKLAERIDEHRRKIGSFRSVDDLLAVPGIGPATLQKVRPLVFARSELDAPPASATAGPKSAGKKDKQLSEPIDINHASLAQLQKLPGIGPKLSQRIVDERDKRPFKTVDELRRVYGIGPKTMEKVRPYVTVGE